MNNSLTEHTDYYNDRTVNGDCVWSRTQNNVQCLVEMLFAASQLIE